MVAADIGDGGIAEAGFHRDEVIWQARGDRVGILTDHEVWLMPRTVLGVVSTIANRAGETFPHTSVSLGSAMAARGWITANGSGDRSANRRIAAVQQRVWVMPRPILDGVDDDPDSTHRPIGRPDIPTPPWQSADSRATDRRARCHRNNGGCRAAGGEDPTTEPVPADDDTSEQADVDQPDEAPVEAPADAAATRTSRTRTGPGRPRPRCRTAFPRQPAGQGRGGKPRTMTHAGSRLLPSSPLTSWCSLTAPGST